MSKRTAWLWSLLWMLALAAPPWGLARADLASGLAWLQGRMVTDGSLLDEAGAMALPPQGRPDAAITLVLGDASAGYLLDGLNAPPPADDPTEFLARRLLALRLGGVGDPAPLIQALQARRNGDGGYGPAAGWPSTPLDTAWTAWALGATDPAQAAAGLGFLRQATQADGGITGASVADRIQATALTALALATQSRTAANLTTLDGLTSWLLRQRGVDGVWLQDTYLTALGLAALAPQVADATQLDGGRRFLLDNQQADGSWAGDPFLTAWALRALLPYHATPPSDPTLASLSGRLVDAHTGLPLAGASLSLDGAQALAAQTDADGRFGFTSLAAGNYGLTISLAGYQGRTSNYTVTAGQAVALGDIPLAPVPPTAAVIQGVATAAATGQPLAGVTVVLTGAISQTVATDASGSFLFTGVPPGAVTLTTDLAGYWPATGSATVAAGQTLSFSPRLYAAVDATPPTTGHFRGTVSDAATGQALADVPIELNGAPLATTGSDGQFDLELAPNAYEFKIARDGYQSLAGSFLLAAGSVADGGPLRLTPIRTLSTLGGRVTDQATGGALAGAQVELVGLTTVTTSQDGQYHFDALSGASFDVRIAAPGHASQLWHLETAAPTDLVRDFALAASAPLSAALDPLTVAPAPVGPESEVVIRATARSTDTQPLSLVPTLHIVNAAGNVVGTAQAGDEAGQLVGAFALDPGASRALVFRWNSGQFPPGDYRPIARLSEAGTINAQAVLGRVVAEQAGSLTITAGSRLAGSVTADPPVVQSGAGTAVHLSSVLRNAGNTDWPARRYRLEAVHTQNGTRTLLQEQVADPLAVGALLELTWADWTPAVNGDYRLELSAADAPGEGTLTQTAYVGEAATGLFTLDRQVVPKGTQTVRGAINVTGTDAITGSVSDPLLPLIKQAVQKAVNYNDPNAVSWTLSNRCLGCHIATQALVGGEVNRDRATFNALNRNTLVNAIATFQQSDGALYASHPEYARTQTILGAWALDDWHAKDDVALTLIRSGDYLISRQEGGGSWYPDHASGWWNDRPANTAVSLKSLIDVRQLIAAAPVGSLNTYTRATWLSGQGLNGTYFLASDADGNVYVSNTNAGTVFRVKPTGAIESWLSGIANPFGIAVAADGTTYVGSSGAIHRRAPDGTRTTLASRRGDGLTLGPDGNLYVSDYSTNRILKITPAGQVSDYLVGNGLNGPEGLAFTATGDLLVANYNDLKILRIKPNKTVETAVAWTNGNPRGLASQGDGWLVGTTTGLYRYTADWQGERLTFAVSHGLAVTPDGRIVTGDGGSGLFNNTPTALDTAAKLAALDTAIGKAANWLLTDANVNTNSHLDVAFRLMGLGAARDFYANQPLAATLSAKMQQADALLRSRQRSDGGWGRNNGNVSDSMVTAMVGMALDELSPSPQDPAIRKAIQWLLNTQSADGSWTSQNGILGTRLAATTWVAIWLPVAMDRIAGIDTDLTLALPANIQLANPTVAPKASAANAHGGLTHTWGLQGVTRAGQALSFDLAFQGLALHETRAAAKDARLTFKNGFTGQPMDAPIDIPAVTASAFLGLEVGTDRVTYGEDDPVAIAAPVGNLGVTLADASVALAIESADGLPVADLGAFPVAGLLSGQTRPVQTTWNTGATYAGAYRVIATLYDADGAEVERAAADFAIVGGSAGGGIVLDGAVHTDQAEYDATATAVITGQIQNLAGNALVRGLVLHERVLGPAGTEIFQASQALPEMAGHALESRDFALVLSQAAAGAYTVEQTATDAQGVVKDRRTAGFRVRSGADTGFGLVGTLAATPAQVPRGDPVTLAFTAANLGNADLTGVPLRVRLIDPAADSVIETWQDAADLPRLGQSVGSHAHGSADLGTGRTYVATLSALIGGTERPLAQAAFQVVEPPVKLDVGREAVTGRVLVLASCQGDEDESESDDKDGDKSDGGGKSDDKSGDKDGGGDKSGDDGYKSGDKDDDGDDKDGDKSGQGHAPTCLEARQTLIHRVLAELGIRHRIVASVDDFRAAFRSGAYDTYWFSGGRAKLENDLAREVREAVYRGDGLLIDGQHDERNRLLDGAGGFLYRGRLGTPAPVVAFADAPFEARHLASRGRGLKLDLAGGQAVAAFPGGTPAVVRNAYGAGHGLAFGFDLPASLAQATLYPYWKGVVEAALTDLKPAAPTAQTGGAYVLERLTVRNQAQAVTGLFRFRLPTGMALADADPALTQEPDGAWLWRFDLPATETRALDLGLRLPPVDGLYGVTAHLDVERNGAVRAYGDYGWQATVATAQADAPALRTTLLAYPFAQTQDRQRRDRAVQALDQATALAADGRWDDALPKLLGAIDLVAALPAPEAPDWRGRLDRLLREYEAKSARAAPP